MILKNRLDNLKKEIQHQNLNGVLISKVANIIYLTNYSGFSNEEREAFLLITPKKQFIFTDGRYASAISKLISNFELIEISSKNKFPDLLKDLCQKLKITKLGIEENDLKINEWKIIKKAAKSLKDFKFHHHRSLKTEEEIRLIKTACRVGDEAFLFIKNKIKLEITEKELMFYLESFIREKGFEPSFKTIVAFGENSAVPHHQTGERKLKTGDFVLMDFGVEFKNYCSDMTRTLIFAKSSDKQKQIYNVVKQAQQDAYEYLKDNFREGVKAAEVDKIARDYILNSGFPSIPHSLGHGIGIEVHEHPYLGPNSKDILKEGMVFSIEPGVYLTQLGGVRIEDLFAIRKNGIEKLTNSDQELLIV